MICFDALLLDMSKKVLMILSKEFSTDPRVNKEASSLVENGYDVTVICWDRKNSFPCKESINDIKVVRISNSFFMSILFHDLLRNPLWWWYAFRKGVELYEEGFDFDVVHCHDLDTLVAGVLLKKKLGIKLVYDAHEIFGYMISRDMPQCIVKFAFLMEKKLVNKVDNIVTVNEPLEEYFKLISGKKPVTVIMNCKDLILDEYTPTRNKVFTVSYIGILHKNRMFPEIVDTIGLMNDVKFIIAGQKENLYNIVKERSKNYSNISFLGTISIGEVIPTTLKSDAIICMINPSDLNDRLALPNKLFEAMVCGRPIITTEGTYSGKLTKKLKCGLVIDYNKESLKKAILELKNNKNLCEKLGRNGLDEAKKSYNWDAQKIKLLKFYNLLKNL